MGVVRIHVVSTVFAAIMCSSLLARGDEPPPRPAEPGIDLSGVHGFDFLLGEWRAHHRRISAVSKKWVEFEGSWSNRALMNGAADVEEHVLNSPDGAYRAVGLRAYDAKTAKWSIWWLDERYPDTLGPPVRGGFAEGIGKFYADDPPDSQSRGRFLWSGITATSARWQQEASEDGGQSWQPNWIAELQRQKPADTVGSARAAAGWKSDFAFLEGAWRVDHRYLRVKPEGREWVEARGTVDHRELTDGWANVEDYMIEASTGTNRAVALRSYNPQDGQWAIWWLDGRYPSIIDAPTRGRFENGLGTFYGETTLDGKRVRVRFVWSATASASPRWEQAYSFDGGQTWDTVWTMQFRRLRR